MKLRSHERNASLRKLQAGKPNLQNFLKLNRQTSKQSKNSRTELRAEMDKVISEKAEKEEAIAEFEVQISELETKLADSPLPEINKKVEFVDQELRRLEGRIRDTEASLNALQLEKEYAEQKIAEAKELIRDLDEKKASRLQKVDSLKDKDQGT